MEKKYIYYHVGPDREGQRLDNALMALHRNTPKNKIYQLIRKGWVRVNLKKSSQDYRLVDGDEIRYPEWISDSESRVIEIVKQPNLLENRIIHEDDDMICVNKPAGLACQKGTNTYVSVIDILKQTYPQISWHLVHRLDKNSSGLLIVAKSVKAASWYAKVFKDNKAQKTYWALVDGKWEINEWFKVDKPILKKQRFAYSEVSIAGKEALSFFRRKQIVNFFSLMEVRIKTGRTHQIRVHSSYMGFPLSGDKKYRSTTSEKHYLLHAAYLSIPLMGKGKYINFYAPLDEMVRKRLLKMGFVKKNLSNEE